MSIKNFLHRPRGHSVIKAQCQVKTGEKEMFSDVDGSQTQKKMLGCRMAVSSRRVMQRLEMSVDRQLLAGMMARAVGVTMLTEVGDDWAGRQHKPADQLEPQPLIYLWWGSVQLARRSLVWQK